MKGIRPAAAAAVTVLSMGREVVERVVLKLYRFLSITNDEEDCGRKPEPDNYE